MGCLVAQNSFAAAPSKQKVYKIQYTKEKKDGPVHTARRYDVSSLPEETRPAAKLPTGSEGFPISIYILARTLSAVKC